MPMPFFGSRQQTCAHCGKSFDSNARFCPQCGQPTEVNAGGCPHCGQPVAANARFCPHCGRQLGGARAPDLRGSVWRKSADEFAVRIEPADLRGTVYKEVEVQPGQQVVLLVDGQADKERQGPGRYTVDSLFDRLLTLGAGRHITGLLVDGGYVSLEFQIPEVFTRDDYAVSARCVVGVQVAKPVDFFANVMKSQRTLTVADLRGFLFDEVRDAVQDVVRNRDLRDLATGLALRDSLADAVDVYLNNTLATSGLGFGGVRTVELHHPRLEALRKQWEEIRIARDEATAGRTQDRERKLAEITQIQPVQVLCIGAHLPLPRLLCHNDIPAIPSSRPPKPPKLSASPMLTTAASRSAFKRPCNSPMRPCNSASRAASEAAERLTGRDAAT